MLNVGRIVRKQKVIQPRHPRLVLGSRLMGSDPLLPVTVYPETAPLPDRPRVDLPSVPNLR
jgi:hypothetical protein